MSRIAHISDTHLGIKQYDSDGVRKEDFGRAFRGAIEVAIESDVDAILHTGDLFDSPNPPLDSVERDCAAGIEMAAEEGVPFYAIVGNHERKLRTQWLDLFEQFETVSRIDSSPVTVGGDTVIYGFDAVRKPNWESKSFEVSAHPSSLCQADSPTRIVALHELFTPLVPEHRGDPYSFPKFLERFETENGWTPDVAALGDYHSQKSVEVNGTVAAYPGSTERCSAAESASRGFYVIQTEPELSLTPKLVSDCSYENTPREFLTTDITATREMTKDDVRTRIEEIPEDITEAVVAVRLTGVPTQKNSHQLGKTAVYDVLEQKSACVPHVIDKRTLEVSHVTENVEETSANTIREEIETEVEKLSLSKTTEEVRQIVESDIPKSEIRRETREVLEVNKNEN